MLLDVNIGNAVPFKPVNVSMILQAILGRGAKEVHGSLAYLASMSSHPWVVYVLRRGQRIALRPFSPCSDVLGCLHQRRSGAKQTVTN